MEIESRSYNPGPVFRPKPFVLSRAEANLLIVTTSWTAQSEAEKAAQMIVEQIEQSSGDDVTRIADQNPQLGEMGNRLQQALVTTGRTIYKQDNLKQARLLIECLVIQVQGSSLAWAQTGQPNLYLLRRGRVAPLVVQPDHSVIDPSLPPLPMVGLGLEAQSKVQAGTTRLQSGDQLVCLAQSWDPLWPQWSSAPDFSQMTKDLINRQPDIAFWCGLINL
jgi:serine/threonine protein phosphatase PrpC